MTTFILKKMHFMHTILIETIQYETDTHVLAMI